jgi:hypothetical protein
VFLFDAQQLRTEQTARGVKQGVASSITKQQWTTAQMHPPGPSRQLAVTPQQAEQLRQFAP